MRRPATILLATAAIATCTVLTTSAVTAAPRQLTAHEVRGQFSLCGFEIAAAQANSPYLVVRDAGTTNVSGIDARIVMAIVYRDASAASAAHRVAHRAAEDRLGERWPFSDDHGPQLLVGYGDSVWRDNVALVQSSSGVLSSMYYVDAQTDEARVARPELFELGFVAARSEYGVDRDFVACLDGAAYGQQRPGEEMTAPIFLQGRPW